MHYTNSTMKLDQLIGYFNGKKINLIPGFQRGRVWRLPARQKLLVNMVSGRPIPAIFLYKDADGPQFSYNILDGKQRLESLILFIGDARADFRVNHVRDYFFSDGEKEQINFSIKMDGEYRAFKDFEEQIVREFREYAIPTIEIDLDDDSTLDEIINLFVDINQTGVRVKRFDIVKAVGRDSPLLRSVLKLIAVPQTRKDDKYYRQTKSAYTRVLQKLQTIENAADNNLKVDRMWERLVELVLFNRTRKHRQPGQLLKTFIKSDSKEDTTSLKASEKKQLANCFNFLDQCYKQTDLGSTRLARDLPHFYTMVTTLLSSPLLEADGAPPDYPAVRAKLLAFAALLSDGADLPKSKSVKDALAKYKEAAERQTTHPGRRNTRQEKFLEILEQL